MSQLNQMQQLWVWQAWLRALDSALWLMIWVLVPHLKTAMQIRMRSRWQLQDHR